MNPGAGGIVELIHYVQNTLYTTWQQPFRCAGAGGFEPPNAGTKTPCLAAWPRPNSKFRLIQVNQGEPKRFNQLNKFSLK